MRYEFFMIFSYSGSGLKGLSLSYIHFFLSLSSLLFAVLNRRIKQDVVLFESMRQLFKCIFKTIVTFLSIPCQYLCFTDGAGFARNIRNSF